MMDEVCYQKCVKFLLDKHQVLIFVHSRNATGQLAKFFIEKAGIAVRKLTYFCKVFISRVKEIYFLLKRVALLQVLILKLKKL